MRKQFIIDTETTSLWPDYPGGTGVIWELALIDRADGTKRLYRMKPDLSKADPLALQVGRYYERTKDMCGDCYLPKNAYDLAKPQVKRESPEWSSPLALARGLAHWLDGATLIAAVPSFDAGYLRAFLNHHGEAATWHYRLRDIGSMAWGFLNGAADGGQYTPCPDMDANTEDFAAALGVDASKFERHTALGDCELVDAMLDVIEGGAR